VGRKAQAEGLAIDRVLANMVELDCLADESIDYAICMFSTLGMVRTHAARMQVLGHVRRMLKPGGTFVLHVHNRWYNALVPQGRQWLVANFLRWAARRDTEPGDKFFDYRGIPQMYLHVFTRRELVRMLCDAKFSIVEIAPLNTQRRHRLRHAWWLGRLRANGWIVACRKS
ncbi:MAG TPA: class I SAM-dependent methyltransferase, partial [Pirellulales bacterium]|nr:class I SAM-dependent methyltransferase [Pirellulales bacterium]